MKAVVQSLIIAFSMYSKIPMPKADWNEDNMKYVMCFFPLVGAVIGGMVLLWSFLGQRLGMSRTFHTVIIIMIPLLVTGGIHMDGLMDTADALGSCQPASRKLEILKDPHAGAFAMVTCVSYFLMTYGIWYDADPDGIPVLAIGFVLSRACSGLSVVTFPLANKSGLAAAFSNASKKQITRIVMAAYILVCVTSMLLINPALGGICSLCAIAVFIYYRRMSDKEFTGITGDLAGYFLQMCELVMAIGVVVGDKICG